MTKGAAMKRTYRMNTNMLDDEFLEAVKTLFKDREIEIEICDVEKDEEVAENLICVPKNKELFLKIIEDVESGRISMIFEPGQY